MKKQKKSQKSQKVKKSKNSCAVALLIRNVFNCTVKKTILDPSGRFFVLKVGIEDKA